MNCTYRNYTKTAAANVQLHKRRERVQVLSSEVQCGRLFDTVCAYKQSYPEMRPFREIRMIKNALPQPHNATQHSPKLLSGDCKAAFVPTHPLGWDDVIQECGVIRHDVGCKQFNTH